MGIATYFYECKNEVWGGQKVVDVVGGWVVGVGWWVIHPPPPTIGIFEKEAKWWEMVGVSKII